LFQSKTNNSKIAFGKHRSLAQLFLSFNYAYLIALGDGIAGLQASSAKENQTNNHKFFVINLSHSMIIGSKFKRPFILLTSKLRNRFISLRNQRVAFYRRT